MADLSPTAAELAQAVREHLDGEVLGQLQGKSVYELRVASNLLGILQREAESGLRACAAEKERLERLLGEDGELEQLNARLADRIREGAVKGNDPELLDHLRRTTLDRLRIDNPKYAAFRRAIGRSGRRNA
jgi:hypothetical protein